MTAHGQTAKESVLAGLAVDDYGTSDERPPLVLLHGLTFDRTMWRPALGVLSRTQSERRALAFDLPGHGQSAPQESYRMDDVVASVHRVIEEAGLRAPVLVGHSIGAIVATIYATRHPTSGVVNVDQPLQTAGFAEFLHSLAEQLQGPAFPSIWNGFLASMHIERLPPDAQELLRATSTPQQALVLGYWDDILAQPASAMDASFESVQAALRSAGLPYLIVAGDDVDDAYREWLHQVLPQAMITVLPGSGHFPQLAHPAAFAACLADTAKWTLLTA